MSTNKNYLHLIKQAVEDYSLGHGSGVSEQGFALALLQGDRTEFSYFKGKGIDGSTAFPLASLSKPLIASVAIESGIDLHSNIKNFFPNWNLSRNITILDLLNQTSGIGEYLYSASEKELNRWTIDEYCKFIQTLPIKPGSNYEYSNSNFVILTKIMEIAHQTPYYSQLSALIVSRLELKETFSFEELAKKNHVAMPHIWNGTQWVKQNLERLCMGYGDSSLFSSIRDMCKWLTSSYFKRYLHSIQARIAEPVPKYQGGLFCEIVDESLVFSHSGSMPGTMSFMVHIPDQDLSLVYLSNCSPQHYEPLIAKLMDAFGVS